MDAKERVALSLQLEYIRECLTLVSLKASHASDNIHIEDFTCAERDIGLAVSYLKNAAQEFRVYQANFAKITERDKGKKNGTP